MFAIPLCSLLKGYRKRAVITTANLLVMLLIPLNLVCAAAPPAHSVSERPLDFAIVEPRFGSTQTGQVDVKLQYVTKNETPTVDVQVNGRTVNRERFTKSCQGGTCTLTGKLTVWDGLRTGENQLSATLTGRLRRPTSATPSSSTPVLLKSTRFDFLQGGLTSGDYNTVNYYTPVSLGLSTLPDGGGPSGNPWLQITTGYPADWSSTADAWAFPGLPGTNNTVTIPYPDVTEGFTCSGAPFQAYVLGRQNPYQRGPDDKYVETGWCGNNISELQSFFQNKMGRPLGSQDLVILGTAPGQTVPAGFDASSLGGTNYSQMPASDYPQAYVMVGVPGAAARTAYENFSIAPTASHPNAYNPSLNGTLMQDQNGNYNFLPSGDTAFQVHSDVNTGSSYITLGNKSYNPWAAINGSFWLLILDRETLTPVNYYLSPDFAADCSNTLPTQPCGAIYTVNSDGGNRLATELNSLSDHDLIFLVSEGCPVQNSSQLGSGLANMLHEIGGASYAVNMMTGGSQCNYSLVTVNDGFHTHPLTDKIALSAAGAFGTNGQSGSLQGFVARNNQGLYDVEGKAQMVPNSDGNALLPPIDYTFEQVASSPRQDWPLVDTAFPIEAYADISFQIMNKLGYTGSRLYDVRYFYTSSDFLATQGLGTVITNYLGTPTSPASTPFTKQAWDNASPAEFTASLQQIGLNWDTSPRTMPTWGITACAAKWPARIRRSSPICSAWRGPSVIIIR